MSTTTSTVTTGMVSSTIAMCLFFGTNFLLYILFYFHKMFTQIELDATSPSKDEESHFLSAHANKEEGLQLQESGKKGGKEKVVAVVPEKELSKPFNGTPTCFYNLTRELTHTGAIMALTYICEKHWIFPHSGKSYSRDLFLFVCILFFAYGIYTRKQIHDLTLLSREQTEEWKGWMQFVFLLYHYFHAEEVYNSVRVMITCYVWMTGFGNFSFFYFKQDYGWLRVAQMLWRLNFSVLFLMWTHGNTWILYYICPMHTFYFLMVYVIMVVKAEEMNYRKWHIRYKILLAGVAIYIVWDINRGLFDILFAALGTAKVVGAAQGSVWEYYFRTSLDHWSAYLGIIFAANYPLTEQYYKRAVMNNPITASGGIFAFFGNYPLVVCGVLMMLVTIWWYCRIYMLEKMQYNLYHSYTAIIPLTSYIFFRNLTPYIRSYISMSMHDLGKTTLETYLLQHHIWLTSNAKTLLTIVPGHPWVNFALATMLFYVTAKELYRLTMSLRGMIIPDDSAIASRNLIGSAVVLIVCFFTAHTLVFFNLVSLLHITLACLCLFCGAISVISQYGHAHTADNPLFQQLAKKGMMYVVGALCIGGLGLFAFSSTQTLTSFTTSSSTTSLSAASVATTTTAYTPTLSCLTETLSSGSWVNTDCSAESHTAFCERSEWAWASAPTSSSTCPISQFSHAQMNRHFANKRVVFMGDSITRLVYHQFNVLMDDTHMYKPDNITSFLLQLQTAVPTSKKSKDKDIDIQSLLKHSDLEFIHPHSNTTVEFIWAPFIQNITSNLNSKKTAYLLNGDTDLLVMGATLWNVLYFHNTESYAKLTGQLANAIGKGKTVQMSGVNLNTGVDASVLQSKPAITWLQPTHLIDARLPTDDKRKYLPEANVEKFRNVTRNSNLNSLNKLGVLLLETEDVSVGRESGSVDGIHYSAEVYSVIAQMTINSYTLRNPSSYVAADANKPYVPKPTGSMSFPSYGFCLLLLSAIMLFSMDNFLGFGFLSLAIFRRQLDWDVAYGPMIRRALSANRNIVLDENANQANSNSGAAGGSAGGVSAAAVESAPLVAVVDGGGSSHGGERDRDGDHSGSRA